MIAVLRNVAMVSVPSKTSLVEDHDASYTFPTATFTQSVSP